MPQLHSGAIWDEYISTKAYKKHQIQCTSTILMRILYVQDADLMLHAIGTFDSKLFTQSGFLTLEIDIK